MQAGQVRAGVVLLLCLDPPLHHLGVGTLELSQLSQLTLAILGWQVQVLGSQSACLSTLQAASSSPNCLLGQPQLQVAGSHLDSEIEWLQESNYSHLPLHSCSSCWSQSQAQARCSSKATSCFFVLASDPVCDVFNIIVIVLLSTEEGTQATPWWHKPWHLITCTSRGSR